MELAKIAVLAMPTGSEQFILPLSYHKPVGQRSIPYYPMRRKGQISTSSSVFC